MFLDEFKGTYVTIYAYFCLSIGITTWTDKDNDLVVFRIFDYAQRIIVSNYFRFMTLSSNYCNEVEQIVIYIYIYLEFIIECRYGFLLHIQLILNFGKCINHCGCSTANVKMWSSQASIQIEKIGKTHQSFSGSTHHHKNENNREWWFS